MRRSAGIGIDLPEARMLFCPAALPLSGQAVGYAAGIIGRHRRDTGSCWRRLSPGRRALLVLACMQRGGTFAGLAAGSGIGTATAWRYIAQTVALVAARVPEPRQVLATANDVGTPAW